MSVWVNFFPACQATFTSGNIYSNAASYDEGGVNIVGGTINLNDCSIYSNSRGDVSSIFNAIASNNLQAVDAAPATAEIVLAATGHSTLIMLE